MGFLLSTGGRPAYRIMKQQIVQLCKTGMNRKTVAKCLRISGSTLYRQRSKRNKLKLKERHHSYIHRDVIQFIYNPHPYPYCYYTNWDRGKEMLLKPTSHSPSKSIRFSYLFFMNCFLLFGKYLILQLLLGNVK